MAKAMGGIGTVKSKKGRKKAHIGPVSPADEIPVPATEALYYKLYSKYVATYGEKTAVLLQVGKFFEMYDSVDKVTGKSQTNVQILSEVCGCATENRESKDPTKHRLMWGFPEIAFMKFTKILTAAGYNCIKYVQEKDATGLVVGRQLSEIISPGTFYDGQRTLGGEEQCMLSVYIEPWLEDKKVHWSIATTAFDISTGQSVSAETDVILIDGKPILDFLQPFWSLYPPAEVAVYWCSETAAPSKANIAALFSTTPPVHIIPLIPADEKTVTADRCRLAFFADIFKRTSALAISEILEVSKTPYVRRSLYHLLRFLQDHNPSFLLGLRNHRLWAPEDCLQLGNSALEQLGMVSNRADTPNDALLHWLQKAQTAMGRRALRERCLKPITDIEILNEFQERIATFRDQSKRQPIQTELRGALDLERIFRRFQLGVGTTRELLQMLKTYAKVKSLIKLTNGTMFEVEDISDHVDGFLGNWSVERIEASEKQVGDAIAVGSAHPWVRGTWAELDTLEDSWMVLESEMKALVAQWETILEEEGALEWKLADDAPFTLITTARRATSLATIVKRKHKTEITATKQGSSTRVVLDCEVLRRLNRDAIRIRAEWKTAVVDQWTHYWAGWIDAESDTFRSVVEFISALDVDTTLASIAEECGYVRPTYKESTATEVAGLSLTGLRHPIIERISEIPYISHNLAFGSLAGEHTISTPAGFLLYGVNAAGKSSLGKALGLAVLMAQCGMPVAASAMTLIPYTGLYTRILGNDNLWAGMSSFVVEMTEFRSILRNSGPRTLVIGDELCAGTETASATSIVAAGVKTLSARKTHFFFATHLHELAEIPEIESSGVVKNYHLTVRSDPAKNVLIYDRILKPGCGSPIYGLEVCRGLDMDEGFLEMAFQFRSRYFSDDGRARVSAYNAAVVVESCGVCGQRDMLETHHIVPQASATPSGHIAPGKHKNTRENLVVLCGGCHDKHHKGLLDIRGWVGTSGGKLLLT